MAETSAAELLDVVDDQDRVIQTLARGEVHRLKLVHRSVHVLVFNRANLLLLQKRSMLKDECRGMWDTSCAGHVESGQGYDETAPRELEEELGFVASQPLTPLFKMQPTANNGQEFAMVYRTSFEGPFSVAADEIDEIRWFDSSTVDSWVESRIAPIEAGERERKLHTPMDPGARNQASDARSASEQKLTSGFCEIWRRFRNLN